MEHSKNWVYFGMIAVLLAISFGVSYHVYQFASPSVQRAHREIDRQNDLTLLESAIIDSISGRSAENQPIAQENPLTVNPSSPEHSDLDLMSELLFQDAIYEMQIQQALADLLLLDNDPITINEPIAISDEESAPLVEQSRQSNHHTYDPSHVIVAHDESAAQQTQSDASLADIDKLTPPEITSSVDGSPCDLCEEECDPCESSCNNGLWRDDPWSYPVRLYLDHVEGRWYDNKTGYSSIGMFLGMPNLIGSLTPIIDVREHFSNNGKYASNMGIGLRFGRSLTFGVNGFYDYRKGDVAGYHQVGAGVEILGSCLDVRLNTYFPVGERVGRSKLHVYDHFSNPNFKATCREFQSAMGGGDAEIGRWLKRLDCCSCFDLYAALGGHYYQTRSNKHEYTYGGEARIASRIGRYLTLEIAGGWDKLYKGMVAGRITISFPIIDPFCCAAKECLSWCDTACGCPADLRPIQRQEYIVLGKKTCCWEWNWDNGGERSCADCGSSSSVSDSTQRR